VADALALTVDVGETAGVVAVGSELVVGVHADSTKATITSTWMPVRMLRLSASPVPAVSPDLCTEARSATQIDLPLFQLVVELELQRG